MKSLVVYSSNTDNTKKLAEAIFETISETKEIFPIDTAPAPDDYDYIAVGFWLQAGKPDPKAAKYLSKIGDNKRLFLFATHGAAVESDHAKNAMEYARNLAPEANLTGVFNCPGEVSPKVLEKLATKPHPPAWLSDAPKAVGHPDEADIDAIKRIITEIL